jgi:tetratricopeptide (TPR) repeat protein
MAQQYPERRQLRKGNRAFEKGKYQDAAGRYMRAQAMAPTLFEPIFNLGNTYYRQQSYDQATKLLQQIATDSLGTPFNRAQAYYNLGNSQFQQKKYSEALESFRNALRLNPNDRDTKFNYAYVKKLLDNQQNNNQNKDQNKDQDKDKKNNQNQQQNQDQNKDKDSNSDSQNQDNNPSDGQQGDNKSDEQQTSSQQQAGISPTEQERMLDAIQAQEDKTQEKLKERKGAVIRLKKNW